MAGLSLLLAFGAVFSVVLFLLGLSCITQPTAIQQRLDQLGGRPESLTELEMREPFQERILRPISRALSNFVVSRTPQSSIDRMRHDILVAGSPANLDVRDLIGMKAFGALIGLSVYLLVLIRNMPMLQGLVIGAALTGIGFYLPTFWLSSKITARKKEIQLALPDALDLLTICVEAGLGFDAALNKITEKWDNALALEFGRALSEMRMGKTRREALRDLSLRTDVPDIMAFIAAIIQADQLGVSIGNVLVTQAEQMRMKRRQRAEELAHQAPIKMIFPMVLLILPALFIVILGPAVPSILDSFGN
jgi:tight adherence protein C